MTYRMTIRTAADLAAEETADRAAQLKLACRDAILAVADETTQANITQAGVIFTAMMAQGETHAAAMAAAGFEDDDLTHVTEFRAWIAGMQTACRTAIDTGDDPVWPDVPTGVYELVARF